MPKAIPECPQKPIPKFDAVHRYEIELVTPMFGGGVQRQVNDSTFPIRPTAIRGQLQFWWRATVGAQYATLAELRAAQTEVWGSTERASRVQVRVENLSTTQPEACARYEMDRNHMGTYRTMPIWNAPFANMALPYALFPFQGQLADGRRQIKSEPASCIHQARFRLTITCNSPVDFSRDIEPALWAWINFGGLGGRTRRGCGAITCKAFAPKDADDLKAAWMRFAPGLFPHQEWPTLAECLMLRTTEQPGDPISVWSYVIGKFRHFRQGEGLGRNAGRQANRPGRSRYPEPETLRRVTRQRLERHVRLAQIPDDAFPRAEIGLPIVFHFQEQGEPPETTLYPSSGRDGKKRERMASPLILKPLALQDGKAIPLILRLRTPSLEGVELRRGETSLNLPITTAIRDPRLSSYPNSPLAGSPNGSAIEAFLAFSRAEGFAEVTR